MERTDPAQYPPRRLKEQIMFGFNAAPFSAVQGKSTVEATNTSTAVVWPGTAFTVPTVVRVVSTTQAYVSVAAAPAPTATTDLMLVPNVPEYIILPAGWKMGVLGQTAGTVCFTPLT
jgi:hypothetical protein